MKRFRVLGVCPAIHSVVLCFLESDGETYQIIEHQNIPVNLTVHAPITGKFQQVYAAMDSHLGRQQSYVIAIEFPVETEDSNDAFVEGGLTGAMAAMANLHKKRIITVSPEQIKAAAERSDTIFNEKSWSDATQKAAFIAIAAILELTE